MFECSICCDDFKDKKKVTCPKCSLECCKSCLKTYLLSKANSPHCMGCKHGFDLKFCIENLTISWLNKIYKNHKKNILFDIEKARFPETMPYVEAVKSIPNLEKEYNNLNDKCVLKSIEIKDCVKKCNVARNTGYKSTKEWQKHQKTKKQLKKELSELSLKKKSFKNKISSIKRGGLGEDNSNNNISKKKFIRACPGDNCNGFLSTSWKCGICNIKVCKDCFEILDSDNHICDPDTLKTASLIKKETRNCPSCAAAIFKISGCDQMWCTQCQVAFSWKTGLKVNGIIHNPHFYEAQRNGLINQVRNPGVEACGGLPYPNQFHKKLNKIFKEYIQTSKFQIYSMEGILVHPDRKCSGSISIISTNPEAQYLRNIIGDMYRGCAHFRHWELDRLRTKVQNNVDNKDLRIKYMLNKIDEKRMKTVIAQRDKAYNKNTEILNIYELFYAILNDKLISIYNNNDNDITSLISYMQEIEKARLYCNEQLSNLEFLYKNQIGQIQGGNKFGYVYNMLDLKIYKFQLPNKNLQFKPIGTPCIRNKINEIITRVYGSLKRDIIYFKFTICQEIRYTKQLLELKNMGFVNKHLNLRILQYTNGNINDQVISILLNPSTLRNFQSSGVTE